MKYTGQRGRPLNIRYQEHLRDFKYNYSKSELAHHLIDNRHALGRMEDVMDIVHFARKGRMMDTLEGLHIYEETKARNQIND